MDIVVILQSLTVKDASNPRFKNLMKSINDAESQKALIEIRVAKFERMSPGYSNIDMDVELAFGKLQVNW